MNLYRTKLRGEELSRLQEAYWKLQEQLKKLVMKNFMEDVSNKKNKFVEEFRKLTFTFADMYNKGGNVITKLKKSITLPTVSIINMMWHCMKRSVCDVNDMP